jgi:hypothetical protein
MGYQVPILLGDDVITGESLAWFWLGITPLTFTITDTCSTYCKVSIIAVSL